MLPNNAAAPVGRLVQRLQMLLAPTEEQTRLSGLQPFLLRANRSRAWVAFVLE